MNEAWQVAELLEDIANNAEVVDVVRRGMRRLFTNTRNAPSRSVMYALAPNQADKTVKVTYYVKVATAMEGVEGTPEEVLEWLSTGLGQDRTVTVEKSPFPNGPYFAITQIRREAHVFDDVKEEMDKLMGRMDSRAASA